MLNCAFCPAGTVCEACDPEANPIVKSGAAAPIPERAILCGLPPPLCAMVILPVRFPTADGANVTEIWQLPPMANVVPQVFVCAKSPEAEIPVMFSGAFPMLVRVEVCAALVAPTVSEANVSVVGLRLTAGPTAVPTNSTDCGLPGSVPLIAILAILDPPAVGVNVTLTVQLPPGAREAPQLCVSVKSELSVPATLIPLMFNPEFPVLISMTGTGLLLVPTGCDGKIARAGSAVSAGPLTPIPARGMATGLALVLSLSVMVPASDPVLVGEKLTVMSQWAPAASELPQSFVWL